jgi:DNA-binding CsgD family transcriptional regulator
MRNLSRILALSIALCLVSSSVDAKPWYKDWKVWLVVGVSLGSSAAATHWSHECREKFGPAPCQGGYGAFAGREGVRFGTSAVMSGLAIWGYREGYPEWWVPAVGFGGYNTYVAIGQTRVGCPAGQEFVYGTKFTCKPADEDAELFRIRKMKLRDLTRAEQTVMHFLSLGYSVRAIARNMGVQNKTIEANISNVRRKVQYGGTIWKKREAHTLESRKAIA